MSYLTFSSQERHIFLLASENTTSLNIRGTNARSVPHLKFWEDRPPSPPRYPPLVGHGGALDKPMTLNRRVVGSTPALAATQGPWASPLLTVACALRRETPIQYPCCSRERL